MADNAMGKVVYHYTSLDVLRKIFAGKKLRFTKMNSLNDKSEYKHGIQLLQNKIVEFEQNNNIINGLDITLLEKFTFPNSLYSMSFTEEGDDLAFWNSYYVDKATPVSIGFANDRVFDNDFIINRCVYGDPYPLMEEQRYLWFRNIFDHNNILQISKNAEFIKITFQTAHIKNKAFSIENEWRAVSFGNNSVIEKFDRNGQDVEYFDQIFNIESIVEIIVGPSKLQETNCHTIASIISNNSLNCSLRKSNIPLEL